MVGVEELVHCSQKGVEDCLSDWQVEEELHHLVVMEVVMGMVMIREEVVGHLPQGEIEEMAMMVVMMEMVVEEMIHHHHLTKDSQGQSRGRRDRQVYVVQGQPRPPGQLGQDGMDGQDGQMPKMPRGIINIPGVAPAPLDTTGLENSFENLGRKMADVLTIQQQTNLTLQDQIRRANDAQMEQTLAMHDLADMTEQITYDSMFAATPIYHGNDNEDFDEWADQLEALCEIKSMKYHEMMGRSSPAVKKIIRSIYPNLRWSLAQQ